jgi:hypothetical protein
MMAGLLSSSEKAAKKSSSTFLNIHNDFHTKLILVFWLKFEEEKFHLIFNSFLTFTFDVFTIFFLT